MDINSVVTKIPAIVASLYDSIYIFNEVEAYKIEYTGEAIKVGAKKSIEELKNEFVSYEEDITLLKNTKKCVKRNNEAEDLIISVIENDVNILFITKIKETVIEEDNKKIIIIADDSPVISKFFTKIMSNDYNVLTANNGNEAIDLVNQYFDKNLVGLFLDLQMPEKNGFEVLEYFKWKGLFKKVPVSIISGEDTKDGIEKAMQYEIIDMLQKPFNEEHAKMIVEKTVRFSPNNN